MAAGTRGRKSAIYGSPATTDGGRQVPVVIETGAVGVFDKAGIQPDRLDGVVEVLIRNAESGADLLLQHGPMLDRLMRHLQREIDARVEMLEELSAAPKTGEIPKGIPAALAELLDLAGKVSIILDRVNKMTLNAVKSKDDAIRLRTFIATGDEQDHGFADMGETALRKIVNAAAHGFQDGGN